MRFLLTVPEGVSTKYDLGELAGETTVPSARPPSEVIQTGESLGIASDSLAQCRLSKSRFCLALNF